MNDARTRAYQLLAVPNPNQPLRASEVGYLELVSSPDPAIAPMIFALEHDRVRVGRFSTAGTYATTSDVFVAVSDDATAISAMNTMFEYLRGSFHVFDTRSRHGTYLNGELVQRRRPIAPGDVIDIGGIPDDAGVRHGHARVIFLGTTAPAGRPIRRAPPRTRFTWETPRGGLALDIDATTGTARAVLNIADWRDAALAEARRIVRSPLVPAAVPDGDALKYEAGCPLAPVARRWASEPRSALTIVADLCEAIASQPVTLGPLDPELLWLRPDGRVVLLGAGLWNIAYRFDSGLRGAMITPRHFRDSPERLHRQTEGPATNVYYAAYLAFELFTGHEPYPAHDTLAYMRAVTSGSVELPAGMPAIARAFAPDPTARPSLRQLAALLRRAA